MAASKPKFRFLRKAKEVKEGTKGKSLNPLKMRLGTLNIDVGCFPFDHKSYH
jgi:hypothetical protein